MIPFDIGSFSAGAPTLNDVGGDIAATLKWALPQLGWTILEDDDDIVLFRQGGGPRQCWLINDRPASHGQTGKWFSNGWVPHAASIADAYAYQWFQPELVEWSGSGTAARPWRIIGNDQFFWWLIDGGTRSPVRYSARPVGTGRLLIPDDDSAFVFPAPIPLSDLGAIEDVTRTGRPAGFRFGRSRQQTGAFSSGGATLNASTLSDNAGRVAAPDPMYIEGEYATQILLHDGSNASFIPRMALPGAYCPVGVWREFEGVISDYPTPYGPRTLENIRTGTLQTVSSVNHTALWMDLDDWSVYFDEEPQLPSTLRPETILGWDGQIRFKMFVPSGPGKIGSFITGAIRRADGTPTAGKVAIRQCSGALGHPVIAVVQADQNGEWELQGLSLSARYRAEVRDPTEALNGAVLDWIQPVPM